MKANIPAPYTELRFIAVDGDEGLKIANVPGGALFLGEDFLTFVPGVCIDTTQEYVFQALLRPLDVPAPKFTVWTTEDARRPRVGDYVRVRPFKVGTDRPFPPPTFKVVELLYNERGVPYAVRLDAKPERPRPLFNDVELDWDAMFAEAGTDAAHADLVRRRHAAEPTETNAADRPPAAKQVAAAEIAAEIERLTEERDRLCDQIQEWDRFAMKIRRDRDDLRDEVAHLRDDLTAAAMLVGEDPNKVPRREGWSVERVDDGWRGLRYEQTQEFPTSERALEEVWRRVNHERREVRASLALENSRLREQIAALTKGAPHPKTGPEPDPIGAFADDADAVDEITTQAMKDREP